MSLKAFLSSVASAILMLSGQTRAGTPQSHAVMVATMKEKVRQWAEIDRSGTGNSAHQGAAKCIDGSANGFPCKNIDLLSFTPLAEMGGGHGNDIWGWTSGRREFALVGTSKGTVFVEVTKATKPSVLGIMRGTNNAESPWRDVKVYQDYAFICSESEGHGVQVFDLKSLLDLPQATDGRIPDLSPVTTYGTTEVSNAHNLAVNEDSGFLYVLSSKGSQSCEGGLHAVDVRDPTNPRFAGCFSAEGSTHDAQCVMYHGPHAVYRGKEICFCYNEDSLAIVDVTDKASMVMISKSTYIGSKYVHQGWLTTDQDMLLMDDELDEYSASDAEQKHAKTLILNVKDLGQPLHVGSFISSEASIDHNLYIDAHYAWQSNYCAGLRVLDLKTVRSATLTEAAFFDAEPSECGADFRGTWSVYPYFASGVIVLNSIGRGLFVLQADLPHHPKPGLTCHSKRVYMPSSKGVSWAGKDMSLKQCQNKCLNAKADAFSYLQKTGGCRCVRTAEAAPPKDVNWAVISGPLDCTQPEPEPEPQPTPTACDTSRVYLQSNKGASWAGKNISLKKCQSKCLKAKADAFSFMPKIGGCRCIRTKEGARTKDVKWSVISGPVDCIGPARRMASTLILV